MPKSHFEMEERSSIMKCAYSFTFKVLKLRREGSLRLEISKYIEGLYMSSAGRRTKTTLGKDYVCAKCTSQGLLIKR